MDIELEARVVRLLLRAAQRRKLVPYGSFHAIFPPTLPLSRRYPVLEKAASTICDPRIADYGALLCTACGLPGPEFYTRFKRVHADRYYAALGVDRTRMLKLVEKQQFAEEAREQVYQHASATFMETHVEMPSTADAGAGRRRSSVNDATSATYRSIVGLCLVVCCVSSLCCVSSTAHAYENDGQVDERIQSAGRGAHLGRELCGYTPATVAEYKERLRHSLSAPPEFNSQWDYGWTRAEPILLQYQSLRQGDPKDYESRVSRICATLRSQAARLRKNTTTPPQSSQ